LQEDNGEVPGHGGERTLRFTFGRTARLALAAGSPAAVLQLQLPASHRVFELRLDHLNLQYANEQ
jgi:hypothetical protein